MPDQVAGVPEHPEDAGPSDPPGTDEEHEADDELVDEMGEESFPGSDPPSTWSGPPT